MARIFGGNTTRIDPQVLERVRRWSDDFWVLFEFPVNGRDVDCLVIRPNPDPDRTATILLTEFKTLNATLWGHWDHPWQVNRAGQAEHLVMSNVNDINPMHQAINAANAVNKFLEETFTVYMPFGTVLAPGQRAKCYPFLLIQTPDPSIHHRITRPQAAYGNLYFSLDIWEQKVLDWNTSASMPLTHAEVEKFVGLLPVRQLEDVPAPPIVEQPAVERPIAEPPGGAIGAPIGAPPSASDRPDETDALAWLRGLQHWVQDIEARVSRLEAQAASQAPRRAPVTLARDLTDAEITALEAAVEDTARDMGKRDFASMLNRVNGHLACDLSKTNYNGFGRARAFFDQGVAQGVIRYGPTLGPAPTIYLATEPVPME